MSRSHCTIFSVLVFSQVGSELRNPRHNPSPLSGWRCCSFSSEIKLIITEQIQQASSPKPPDVTLRRPGRRTSALSTVVLCECDSALAALPTAPGTPHRHRSHHNLVLGQDGDTSEGRSLLSLQLPPLTR